MANRPSVPSRSSTSKCCVIVRSPCSCSQQMPCCVSPTSHGPLRSSSLRSWCGPLETWSVASWCTAHARVTPRATVLWSTWRRIRPPGPNRSCWVNSLGPACCMCTGPKWDRWRSPRFTRAASVWTACLPASWLLRICWTHWLTCRSLSSARWVKIN